MSDNGNTGTPEEDGIEGTDFQKPVSIGIDRHPITYEIGIVIGIGEEKTWMPVQTAKRLVGEIDITLIQILALSTINGMMAASRMNEPPNGIITP